jgi:hypothetical protein
MVASELVRIARGLVGREVRFGEIRKGQRFTYKGKTWVRTTGKFALPENDIGNGQSSWPFEVDTMVEKELEMSDLNSEERRIVEGGALGWGLIALSDLWTEGITVSKDGKENSELEKKAENILENHYQRAKDKGVVFVRKER